MGRKRIRMPPLTIDALRREARRFARQESQHPEPTLYGVTDGKAVGTYFELKFREHLLSRYQFSIGNAAKGIDFPELNVDVKVTSARQPQSSCPFKSARQKVYGLGYSILVFVYEKSDDSRKRTSTLRVKHVIWIDERRTGDFQTTTGLLQILQNDGNIDDVVAFLTDRMLPVDEIGVTRLAEEVIAHPPEVGVLTISNALQWRLQYGHAIQKAGSMEGVVKVQ